MNDKVDVTDIEKKINKIMELTGASKDKAIVALHDCANELDKAIDMILEGDSINESEWKSQARKKKPKVAGGKDAEQSGGKGHLNGDAKRGAPGNRQQAGRPLRGKNQQIAVASTDRDKSFGPKQPSDRPRRADWKATNNDESSAASQKESEPIDENSKVDEWDNDAGTATSTSRDQTQGSRDRGKSFGNDGQSYSRSQRFPANRDSQDGRPERRPPSTRGPYNQRNFGTGGDRNHPMSNQRDRPGGERRNNYPNKNFTKKPGGYQSSIDTWSNVTAVSADPNNRSHDFAQMTVGNWSDVVSSTAGASSVQPSTAAAQPPAAANTAADPDLSENDEWAEPSANLIEPTKVFNKDNQSAASIVAGNLSTQPTKPDDHQLPKMPNLASIVSGVKPVPQPAAQQPQPPTVQAPAAQHHKQSPSQKPAATQQPINLHHSRNNEPLSNSSNHPMSSSQPASQLHHKASQPQQPSAPHHQPQPQRHQPTNQQQQQNKIDLAALLKSSQPNQQQSAQQQQQQLGNLPSDQMNKLIRGNIQQQAQQQQAQRNNQSEPNAYGAALLQSLQQRVVHEMDNKSSNISDFVSQQISSKNLVNIPSSNYGAQNAQLHFDNQPHHLHHQGAGDSATIDQKSLIEKKRRQTKIPETAVEMPNSDHISSLNVQFGALDFGADSYLNDDQITNKPANFMNNSRDKRDQSSSLLGTVRGGQAAADKQSHQTKDILSNIDHHQQHLQDNLMQHHQEHSRNKQPAGYQKSSASLYSGGNQQHNENSMNSYKNTSYGSNQNDSHSTSTMYPPNLQNYGGYPVNSYGGSANHAASNSQAANQNSVNTSQKINLKDLDTSSTGHNNSNASISTTSGSLGLVTNNTTVTTNVLKNSLTATGKGNMQQPNMAQQPNVAPLLGTPQYIMSQPGLSAFYAAPVYDIPMQAQDHTFRYNQNAQDVKYSRSDAQDGQSSHGSVQSTQAPVTQTPNHQIFGQFPPYFFYTGMMAQSLYQTPPQSVPFLPVQPNPASAGNQPHANSNHSTGFPPKGAQNQSAYSASAYSSAGYDPSLGQLQGQDYGKQSYSSGPNNSQAQQKGNQMSSGGSNDLTNSNMYTKSHAQLTKVRVWDSLLSLHFESLL